MYLALQYYRLHYTGTNYAQIVFTILKIHNMVIQCFVINLLNQQDNK